MTALNIFLIILLLLIMTVSTISIVFGMPGTLVSFLAVLMFVIVTKAHFIGWTTVAVLALMTLVAELGEWLLGIKDSRKAGVSRKGIAASIIGGVAGSIALAPFLLGIGAILGAVLGAFLGAFTVSLMENKPAADALYKGWISAIGRLKGTIFKGAISIVMIVVCIVEIL
ncbi:MAG: DUF456 domain-containing protein [Deltaproteobacteria bacterium]|nr:DUF456 domain-containing protein [Deltaproteobacteria bacterium]MCL5277867.1 DUF456 domain-containing protein [Deltaproteobacteria bacterium]